MDANEKKIKIKKVNLTLILYDKNVSTKKMLRLVDTKVD